LLWAPTRSFGASPRTRQISNASAVPGSTAFGRITDGTVIDVQELPASDGHHSAVFLIYKYDVAGVSYECSQDVTYLRQWINLHSCRLGLPTSVKYDPTIPAIRWSSRKVGWG